jgi:hypothetical protein
VSALITTLSEPQSLTRADVHHSCLIKGLNPYDAVVQSKLMIAFACCSIVRGAKICLLKEYPIVTHRGAGVHSGTTLTVDLCHQCLWTICLFRTYPRVLTTSTISIFRLRPRLYSALTACICETAYRQSAV